MRWDIRWVPETGSTNEDAFALGKSGAPAGIVCAAETQRAGRGRMDRSWFSPPRRGLYCSVLLRPDLPLSRAGFLSFCAALAMTDALGEAGLPAMIKWPNDIVFGGKKLCGILSACDGDASGLRFAVVGSGLNLRSGSYPEELRDRAGCLEDFGIFVDRNSLLNAYLDHLESWVLILQRDGFPPLREKLLERLALLSRLVVVSGGQQAEGIVLGIGAEGELLIRTSDGAVVSVTCGDVSVRGMNGYV